MAEVTTKQLQLAKGYLEEAAGKAVATLDHYGITKEHFARIATTALMKNPDIANCTKLSLNKAVFACAERGLVPDGEQCAIVPFGKDATLMVMVGGKLDLARRSIKGISFEYGLVWKAEIEAKQFVHIKGTSPDIQHTPLAECKRGWGEIYAAYCIAFIPGNNRPESAVLYKQELEEHRAFAKTQKMWNKHPGQMCIKSAVHQCCKRLPTRGNGYLFDDHGVTEDENQVVDITPKKDDDAKPTGRAKVQEMQPKQPERQAEQLEPQAEPGEAASNAPPPITDEMAEALNNAGF